MNCGDVRIEVNYWPGSALYVKPVTCAVNVLEVSH